MEKESSSERSYDELKQEWEQRAKEIQELEQRNRKLWQILRVHRDNPRREIGLREEAQERERVERITKKQEDRRLASIDYAEKNKYRLESSIDEMLVQLTTRTAMKVESTQEWKSSAYAQSQHAISVGITANYPILIEKSCHLLTLMGVKGWEDPKKFYHRAN
jgi:chromatin segregation and condensation protein Rec8/ScpA/Scc1 (kleisin family)